jgi:hypothetical protein
VWSKSRAAVAYCSANAVASIWFQPRWVPMTRLATSLAVAGAAGWSLLRLQRPP